MAHHRARRVDLEGGDDDVLVEEVVQVLVGGHAGHDLAGVVVEHRAGVAVRDAGGELLQGDVDEPSTAVGTRRDEAAAHLVHAAPLERGEIERPGDGDVVADDDRVPHLLGRPPPGPLAPHVVAEHAVDRLEVVGQVVLGEQVHEERAAHPEGQLGVGFVERLARLRGNGPLPRNQLVGEPGLGGTEVPLEEAPDCGYELLDQVVRDHRRSHAVSLPTCR